MAKKLTTKQQVFVAEYLVDLNATRAAIAAGYSDKNADSMGSQLLSNPKVSEEIAKKTGKRMGKLEITADRVLEETARLAFYDPRKFFESDGSLKRVTDLDDDTAMAMSGLEVTELFEGTGDQKHAYGLLKKVKLSSKINALELLGKHLKLFSDNVEHSGTVGLQLIHSIPQPRREDDKLLEG